LAHPQPQLQQQASPPAAALQPQQPWKPGLSSRCNDADSSGGNTRHVAQPPRMTLSWSPGLHAARMQFGTTRDSTEPQQQRQPQPQQAETCQHHHTESAAGAPAAAGAARPSMQNRDQAPQTRATPPALLARRQRPQPQQASPWAHGSWEARSEGAESEQVSAVDAAGSDGCAANDLRVPSVQCQLLWCQPSCAFTGSCATGGSLV
jgi:hypothetical protein